VSGLLDAFKHSIIDIGTVTDKIIALFPQDKQPDAIGTGGICKHCGEPIAIRNPSGYCDHLHYPDNCKVCSGKIEQKMIECGYYPMKPKRERIALIDQQAVNLIDKINEIITRLNSEGR
jgi:hypothetical protein